MPNTKNQSAEFKGSLFALPIIKIINLDLDAIAACVEKTVTQSPRFFENAPVVLDLTQLTEITKETLDGILALLKQQKMFPVGAQCSNPEFKEILLEAELAIMPISKTSLSNEAWTEKKSTEPTKQTATQKANEVPASLKNASTKVITQPVRSGQQILATEGDLLVLNTVSPGAELLATGNIHVYGALRGRALAGIHGNQNARIFCHELDAELISIAGHYQASEQLKADAEKGKIVHIYLDNEQLRVDHL